MQRKINIAFYHSKDEDGTPTSQESHTFESLVQRFTGMGVVRKVSAFTKEHTDYAKSGPCFLAGECPERGTVLSRSCVVLDGDSHADSLALLDLTKGYFRIIWQTYKSGLQPTSVKDLWEIAPEGVDTYRIRIVLPLDRDIPASEWSPEAMKQAFPGSDKAVTDLKRVAYCQSTWDDNPERLEVDSDGDQFYPADKLIGLVPKQMPSALADYEDTAIEVATTEHLSRLWETLRKRQDERSKRLARLVYAVWKGNNLDKQGRHQASIDVCNCIGTAKGLKECSVESILDLCMPTLDAMQLDGSDETRENWREKITSWRGKVAAEAALLDFELPLPGEPGTNSLGEEAEAPGEVEASVDPQIVLDSAFAAYTGKKGAYQFFHIKEGDVCTRLDDIDSMVTEVMDKARGESKDGGEIQFNAKQAKTLIDNWKGTGRKLPYDPVPSRFLSEPGFCYQRLPFDLEQGETPAWDEFCSRLSNADYFKAFIWTAFEPKNKGRQILWMTGNGQDGKSTAMSAIAKALGEASCATKVNIFESKHGTSMLEGKRLVYVADCKDTRLLMNGSVREATSGDESVIEPKGKTPYSKALNLKMIVFSNQLPSVSSQQADISRVLPMEVAPSKNTDDPQWGEKLYEQLSHFLWDCRETYNRICPHHGNFRLDEATKAMIDDFAASYEDDFETAVRDYLVITGNALDRVNRPELNKKLRDRAMGNGWTEPKIIAFRAYLHRVHKIGTQKSSGTWFFTGCHKKGEKAANPLTLVDNTAETVEDAACPF